MGDGQIVRRGIRPQPERRLFYIEGLADLGLGSINLIVQQMGRQVDKPGRNIRDQFFKPIEFIIFFFFEF